METLADYKKRIDAALADIDPEVLRYNEDEFWMIRSHYQFIEYVGEKRRKFNTLIALHLAVGLHNGVYRKLPVMKNGEAHRPPYVIHCLTVCKMLADLPLPFTPEEIDILLAAALCHDMIEDVPFEDGGRELYTKYHLDPRVYEIVKLVSKRDDFTEEEEQEFFQKIMENKFALLIKLSDRGHNVTDLFNMKEAKIREYIGETRKYFLPMCDYARAHYPELSFVADVMQDQIVVLTKTVEMLADRHNKVMAGLQTELDELRMENEDLQKRYEEMRKEA